MTCTDWDTCKVTSADISPDGKMIVLLGYGKYWLITDFDLNDFSKATVEEVDIGIRSQLESVSFMNENTLILSDEKSRNTGGNLYTLKLN